MEIFWFTFLDTTFPLGCFICRCGKNKHRTLMSQYRYHAASAYIPLKVKVKSLSCVRLFATAWTVAYQAPLPMEFSRQEYWSGLPFPSPGDLPDPGIELCSPTLQVDTLPSEPPGKPLYSLRYSKTENIRKTISLIPHSLRRGGGADLKFVHP